ncbi:ANGPT4 [Cordylochernes scorpioides]|uniref:ANGPT4 n=1 Tax=Cordylochernes scorpioides TaxID=51811 RepID=A0ABY6KAI3_9ARAC|nr:ANGPT4 [Cordylochernes scorpioides]
MFFSEGRALFRRQNSICWNRNQLNIDLACSLISRNGTAYSTLTSANSAKRVIQRRGKFRNPPNYFEREHFDYEYGFGNPEKEFWMGNYYIETLINRDFWELRIDLWEQDDTHYHSLYKDFWIEPFSENDDSYKLHFGNYYTGNAGEYC